MGSFRSQCLAALQFIPAQFPAWQLVPNLVVGLAIPLIIHHRMASKNGSYDAEATDPALLARNSEVKSFTTSRTTYNGIRVFYRRHPQADKLPKDPAPVPLLVFIHGLGGSVAQFNSLLTSLTPIASCLAVDLPGCGVSKFINTSWDDYTTDSLVELLETVIESYREKERRQGVVLIGHSMGASLAALLASPRAKVRSELSQHVLGLVAICPKAGPPTETQTRQLRTLLYIPGFIFDLWRAWDRWGGVESPSVRRFLGPNADPEAKRLQHLYNCQSRTPVFRRMAWGSFPNYRNGHAEGGMPSGDVWSRLSLPVFLVGGEEDNVCKPEEVSKIVAFINGPKLPASWDLVEEDAVKDTATTTAPVDTDSSSSSDAAHASPSGSLPESVSDIQSQDFVRVKVPSEHRESSEDPVTPIEATQTIPPLSLRPKKAVCERILPKPANHALLYTPSTAPVLAGLISDFLADKITGRLDLGWQLQYLCRDGKWDVKNLEKWKSVAPVSDEIGGVFRAIKTLREVDDVHCPREFVHNWGTVIRDIIDISHDNPVYDPQGLEAGGIKYHKFPTVSKVPPSDVEVKGFIELVDKIRESQKTRNVGDGAVVGVHCHYGFNRTGFLIVCYLVERCGFTPIAAIEHFAKCRPHGIKHAHFKDRLCVPERTPLLADAPRRDSRESDRAAEEEDAAIHNTALPSRASRTREIALFAWALLATAAVIVLAVVVQHGRTTTRPSYPAPVSPPQTAASKKPPGKRNLVFMVSDGMGPASLSLTRSFRQVTEGLPVGDTLTLDKHFWGSSRTRSSSSFVTDSAAGATAFSCGKKSYNTAISMLPDFTPCGTVLEAAKRAGYATGLVVTTDITDATPACFASHVYYRSQGDEIAMQEVGEGVLGRTVDLMLGGGRCHFLPNTTAGSCRFDDVDVTKIAREKHGFSYADDRAGFDALALGKNVSLPVLGLFATADVPFEIDRRNMADVYPSLSEMALTGLTALQEATKDSDKGFFLMIEGSRIDHTGHVNDPAAQVREVLEYDKTFKLVLDFLAESDTEGVLVATSDHETGGLALALQAPGELPVYNWHPPVLAKANASSEYLAHLLVEHMAAFQDETEDELRNWIKDDLVRGRLGIHDALEVEINALASNPAAAIHAFARMVSLRARIGWSTHGHSAVDVNVYSSGGPGTERIRGNVENTEVGEFLREYLEVDVDSITKELRQKMKSGEPPLVAEEVASSVEGHSLEWMMEQLV
ncbi:alkaline phosphatase-like protein [Cercophora newfieldiana]|uniref:Alkaline phosphatase n=1 Tax=Cercophora newfieldiana TaxID=92897 RepID=A0AA39Y7Z2_9PEZI|nr:alkaline phosphatase-like protein [Cercophora newfieldiana]